MKIPLRSVAATLGLDVSSDVEVTGWSVDSRTVQPGDLFFALRGPAHDGHAYVGQVFQKGAVAAVVDREVEVSGVVLHIDDSLRALQAIARAARQTFPGDVV